MYTVRPKRIFAAVQNCDGFGVKAASVALNKNICRVYRKRAVYVYRYALIAVNHMLIYDFAERIKKLLRSAYRKSGDNDIAAAVECFLYYIRKLRH